ncbi:proline-rich domain-containing protein [Nesterenkonia muleiensis]|uniref:proline-rich domain-containing protein n=1 Tax=Nesterenkonia muleiensis TaxID=2282648 RepID=UPI000E76024E|nr:proline-rich domain-containing protein [Nesterenkonia muleiensis]
MSTSPRDDDTSPDSAKDTSAAEQGQETRPQPRYGAYASPSDAGRHPDAETQPGAAGGPGGSSDSETTDSYNPYTPPTWGQPGSGQSASAQTGPSPYGGGPYSTNQPSPYGNPDGGQPSQQPHQPSWNQPGGPQQGGYPQGSYPPQSPGAPQRPKRPATLWTVLAALLAAGATSLIWGIYVFVTIPTQTMSGVFGGNFSELMAEELERQSAQDPELQELSPQEIEEVMLFSIGMFALIWAVVLLAVYVATAFLGAMAGNPGRIIATIWAGLSLLFLLLGHDGASYGLISATVAFSVVALVMMWLPASSQYIRHRRWAKETMRNGYQGYTGQQ